MRTKSQNYDSVLHKSIQATPEEWLAPFDLVLSQMFNTAFPQASKELGENFFIKGSYPKVNVLNEEEQVTIEAAIPGLARDNVSIVIADNILTIIGDKNQIAEITESQFIRRELKRSAFKRSFSLSNNLDVDSISATQKNGILTIRIRKKVVIPHPSIDRKTIEIT